MHLGDLPIVLQSKEITQVLELCSLTLPAADAWQISIYIYLQIYLFVFVYL
jgi:hypothetical protein